MCRLGVETDLSRSGWVYALLWGRTAGPPGWKRVLRLHVPNEGFRSRDCDEVAVREREARERLSCHLVTKTRFLLSFSGSFHLLLQRLENPNRHQILSLLHPNVCHGEPNPYLHSLGQILPPLSRRPAYTHHPPPIFITTLPTNSPSFPPFLFGTTPHRPRH